MKASVSLSKLPAGYGHYKLTINYNNETLSATTSDMTLIDQMNSEEDELALQAKQTGIEFVLDRNNIGNYKVTYEYSHRYGNEFFIEIEEMI